MFELMRGLPIFKGFADDDLARLASQVHNRQLAAGEVLFRQGEAGHACYVVLDGELEVIGHPGQTEVRLEICRPGRMIGEMALIDPSPRSATVRAVTASHLAVFDEQAFLELMHGNPGLTLDLLRNSTARLRTTSQQMIADMEAKNAELLLAYNELQDAQAERIRLGKIEEELAVARRIQELFLPHSLPQPPGWQIAAFNRGAQEIGGDFFDCIESEHGASTMFITLFYGMLEPTTGRLGYINAGHNPPLIISADGQSVRELESSALPLGIVPGQTYETNALILAPGELLVGFSDGITEAMNQSGEPYGDRRLTQALQAHAGQPAQTLVRTITQRVDEFVAGAPQADDMTMLVIKRSV